MDKLIMDSHAKINLALDVLGKRSDGYHEIDTIMQSISLKDRLEFESLEERGLLVIDSNSQEIPLNEDNLVYKAWKVLKDRFEINGGLHIYIDKKIPIGAGLAGGSANGATTLKALNLIWDLGLTEGELMDIGKDLGADIPFCLLGGTARAEGIGEKLTVLPSFSGYKLLVCNPGIQVDTALAYELLDLDGDRLDIGGLARAMEAEDLEEMRGLMANKMEDRVIEKFPVIGRIKKEMDRLGSRATMMTGSGSTVYGIFEDEEELEEAYRVLKKDFDRVYICETI